MGTRTGTADLPLHGSMDMFSIAGFLWPPRFVLLSVLALLGCGAAPIACRSELTSYVACGCGCCGGTTPTRVCIESTGKCLEDLIAEDQAARANPGCAMAGCALGVEYVRCAGPGG